MGFVVDLVQLRSNVDALKGQREALRSRLTQTAEELVRLRSEEDVLNEALVVFRQLVDNEVAGAIHILQRLQTEGLKAVFKDQDLSVRADVQTQRGKVSVDLVTIQEVGGRVIEGSSSDSFGGAVQTVQSILMRVIVLHLKGLRPVLFLDESLPALDASYAANMGQFLTTLCDRLDMDILLVTHNATLVESAQRAYRIEKRNGVAKFTEV